MEPEEIDDDSQEEKARKMDLRQKRKDKQKAQNDCFYVDSNKLKLQTKSQ